MMNYIRHIKTGLFAAFIAFPASYAYAADVPGKALQDRVKTVFSHSAVQNTQNFNVKTELYAQRGGQKISPREAKSIAMRHVGGANYVNIQMVDGNTYRVRLQKNGQIIDVYVDARTGAVK